MKVSAQFEGGSDAEEDKKEPMEVGLKKNLK